MPNRPGYHLSRYSAPLVPTASHAGHEDSPTRHAGSSIDVSRVGTPDTDSPKSRSGFETLGGTPPGTPPMISPALPGVGSGGKKKPGFSLNLKEPVRCSLSLPPT